jgi:hypothetical protein
VDAEGADAAAAVGLDVDGRWYEDGGERLVARALAALWSVHTGSSPLNVS